MSVAREGLVLPDKGGSVVERIPAEYREEYPYIGARNRRYKQEVSEAVADHIDDGTLSTPITTAQIVRLLADTPFEDGEFIKWGLTSYCDPSVHEGMDWFGTDIEGNVASYEATLAQRPRPKQILVNGWEKRQVFERQAGERVFWITKPVRLGESETVKRNSRQVSAELPVWVSAAGLGSRCVGLFAEVKFTTRNEYISFSDTLILGKISPETGIAETPYHALCDDSSERGRYTGCRPTDGTMFRANKMANLIVSLTAPA